MPKEPEPRLSPGVEIATDLTCVAVGAVAAVDFAGFTLQDLSINLSRIPSDLVIAAVPIIITAVALKNAVGEINKLPEPPLRIPTDIEIWSAQQQINATRIAPETLVSTTITSLAKI